MNKKTKVILIGLILLMSSVSVFAAEEVTPKCLANECLKGNKCEAKADLEMNCKGNVRYAILGKQTRTATCEEGKGWQYSDWSGACECKKPYEWNGLFCRLSSALKVRTWCLVNTADGSTSILAKTQEPLSANVAVEVEIGGYFLENPEGETRFKLPKKKESFIILAGQNEKRINGIDMPRPEARKDGKEYFYAFCDVLSQKAKWINIDDN